MKRHAFGGVLVVLGLLVPMALLLLSCGGGGGSGTSGTSDGSGGSATSGTVSVAITDAKPMLPAGATHVFVTFDEVSVHKEGGDWISLPVVAPAPHTIDLLQFSEGNTTQLVPPVQLGSGKYTQLRLGVTSASIVFDTNGDGVDDDTEPLEVPSDSLKTAQEFNFEVHGGGAVDLVVDFDLSRSIVVTGNQRLKLKPVLHIVQTLEAATIQGSIPAAAFGNTSEATVTVWWDKNTSCGLDETVDEMYTRVTVAKAEPAAEFEIFWLVPNEAYIIQIDVGGNRFFFTVPGPSNGVCQEVQPGAIYDLGSATIQGTIKATTFAGSTPAVVTVLFDPHGDGVGDPSGDDTAYTKVTLTKPAIGDATFSISVLPNQPYVVQVETNGTPPPEYQEAIPADELPAGTIFNLNFGNPI